jgi:DNA-binding transcriptional LysR family regulator
MQITARDGLQRTTSWRFDDILTFMATVETGSVTSAANRLNVSKSVISERISDLEAKLGVELVHRSTLKPTEAGLSFYERIAPAIWDIAEAVYDFGCLPLCAPCPAQSERIH